jgi:hypothetical protein
MTKVRKVAVLRGREGLWQLEAWCGQCNAGASCGAPVVERTEKIVKDAMARESICKSTYMGKPRNVCGWPLSFGWLFVPLSSDPS